MFTAVKAPPRQSPGRRSMGKTYRVGVAVRIAERSGTIPSCLLVNHWGSAARTADGAVNGQEVLSQLRYRAYGEHST